MPWWGWLLLGAGGATALLVCAYLLLRRRVELLPNAERLLASERLRAAEERTADISRATELERVAVELEAELRAIAADRRRKMEDLDESLRKRYARLAGDPDALLRRLDEIVGARRRD